MGKDAFSELDSFVVDKPKTIKKDSVENKKTKNKSMQDEFIRMSATLAVRELSRNGKVVFTVITVVIFEAVGIFATIAKLIEILK
jgi:hypothetical protein